MIGGFSGVHEWENRAAGTGEERPSLMIEVGGNETKIEGGRKEEWLENRVKNERGLMRNECV